MYSLRSVPYALLFLSTQALVNACQSSHNNPRGDSDDDDDDDGDDCKSSFSRSHSSTGRATATTNHSSSTASATFGPGLGQLPETRTSHGGISKGGIAGIVIAIVAALLLALGALLLCRRRRRRGINGGSAFLARDNASGEKSEAMHTLLSPSSPTTSSSAFPQPRTTGTTAAIALGAAAAAASHNAARYTGNRSQSTEPITTTRNISHHASPSASSLPNPYEYHDEPAEAVDSHGAQVNRDRALPPTPPDTVDGHTSSHHGTSTSGSTTARSSTLLSPGPSSFPPSSFAPSSFAESSLNRNSTFSTTTSIASSRLHSEMAAYQKRLEVHHEKELQERDAEGKNDGIPADPPPMYEENIPSGDALDLPGSAGQSGAGHS